jgi:hypothetical protein
VIALQHQQRVGEQRVNDRGVPHGVPTIFGLGLQPRQLLAGENESVIEAECLEVSDIPMQDLFERVPMQEADVITLVEK